MQFLSSIQHLPLKMRLQQLLCSLFFLILINTIILCSSYPESPENPEGLTPLGYLEKDIGAYKGNVSGNFSRLKKYLSSLGYMDAKFDTRHHPNDVFDEKLESAVRRYQQFFKLQVTGVLDNQTYSILIGPRCGVADLTRHKIAPPNSWTNGTKRTITYAFPPDIEVEAENSDRDTGTAAAFAEWGRVIGINFQVSPNYDQADIKISFNRWDETPAYAFDGPGGTIAYAFAPTDGKIFYDSSEPWADGVISDVFDLQTMGLHELGHILGLGHSNDPASIMFPLMAPGVRKGLGQGDINKIRALYKR